MSRLPLTLLLMAIALGAVVALSVPAGSSTAAAPRAASDLVREYPLGERPLCCAERATARTASPYGRPSPDEPGHPLTPGTLLLALALLTALASLGWASRRFARHGQQWVRLRHRRRWHIGPRTYRLAQAHGFRYSRSRDALVPGIWHGAFGPVLKLRRTGSHAPAWSPRRQTGGPEGPPVKARDARP